MMVMWETNIISVIYLFIYFIFAENQCYLMEMMRMCGLVGWLQKGGVLKMVLAYGCKQIYDA